MKLAWGSLLLALTTTFTFVVTAGEAYAQGYKAGVARVVITPELGLWMAGYANRMKPAEGKVHELYAKALAIEDADGKRFVLVTTDLLGLPRDLSDAIAAEIQRTTSLQRDQLLLTSSHTHCGPVLRGPLFDMYDMPADQQPKLERYRAELKGKLIQVITQALRNMQPAQLAIGTSTARFAVNRRQVTERGIVGGANPDGPVDHDVPVLRVTSLPPLSPPSKGGDRGGGLRAVVFGYACHNTTLQFYQWCGDYAGFAQAHIEEKHPGAVALFWAGCGADANPLPRSTIELCQKYGKELADAVEAVLGSRMKPVSGKLGARYATISLPFDTLPSRDQLLAESLSSDRPQRIRAGRLLKILDTGGKIDSEYAHYPIQVWRLGDQLVWIALGGEVVVDYSHRLKKELGRKQTVWVTAYANDVMAYIPSLRVLKEGGYEGDTSMIYYGLPAKWGPSIEQRIVGRVRELVGR